MKNNIYIYCSVYNRGTSIDDVKKILETLTNKEIDGLFDDILSLNVMTKDKQKAECLKLIFAEMRGRNLIPIYRRPGDGIRIKVLKLEDFYEQMEKSIYSNVVNEMRML